MKNEKEACWEGNVAFTKEHDKQAFSALSWLARAAARDKTRHFMEGIFNEVIDGNRVFVATDGSRLHRVEFPGDPWRFAGVPAGKNLAFKTDLKQITFTTEIKEGFLNYKEAIPDVTDAIPSDIFNITISKESGYTEALYGFYSRGIKVRALHVAGLNDAGYNEWEVYPVRNVVVCMRDVAGLVYTALFARMKF
jgi:hypothetical protein